VFSLAKLEIDPHRIFRSLSVVTTDIPTAPCQIPKIDVTSGTGTFDVIKPHPQHIPPPRPLPSRQIGMYQMAGPVSKQLLGRRFLKVIVLKIVILCAAQYYLSAIIK
jgi:hypothetical protein